LPSKREVKAGRANEPERGGRKNKNPPKNMGGKSDHRKKV